MFDWDDVNRKHIAEHGVTPREAEEVITNSPIDLHEQFQDDEERLMQLGVTDAMRVLVVVTTWREDLIRVVTAYPAPPALRELYGGERGG